jgi:hypothetical protein
MTGDKSVSELQNLKLQSGCIVRWEREPCNFPGSALENPMVRKASGGQRACPPPPSAHCSVSLAVL